MKLLIMKKPDYKKIYEDIISFNYPEKMEICRNLLNKNEWTALDVISINNILFDKDIDRSNNSKFRSYDEQTIVKILHYQKELGLNNSELALHFRLSRNTVSKWKKIFGKLR